MMLRLAAAVLVPVLVFLAPASARAQSAAPVPPARPDSAAVSAPADSVTVPVRDATRWVEREVVRVPVGTTPLDPPDTTRAAAPARRKDGLPAPVQRIALLAGMGFPLAPSSLTSTWNPGGLFGAAMDFDLEPRFGVRLRGEWAQLPFDEREFLKKTGRYGTGALVEGGDASLVLLAVMPRLHTRGAWPRFYLEAGPGFGMVRSGDALLYDPVTAELFENPSDQEFRGGMSAGAGVEFGRRDGSGFFVDVHWSTIYTKDGATQYLPVSVGFLFP